MLDFVELSGRVSSVSNVSCVDCVVSSVDVEEPLMSKLEVKSRREGISCGREIQGISGSKSLSWGRVCSRLALLYSSESNCPLSLY
jgi:hypothetical protein